MAVLLYHMFSFLVLFSYGLYHLVCSTRAHLLQPLTKSPPSPPHHQHHLYSARPYHPLPHRHPILRHLPLLIAFVSLLIGILQSLRSSLSPDPLRPAHLLVALQTLVVLLLFLILVIALFLSHSAPHLLPLPSDITFLLAAIAFALLAFISHNSASNTPASDLQAHCDRLSGAVSVASALAAGALAVSPRLFIAELTLAGSIIFQGIWSLQTGLSLYVELVIPKGCHRLLDVPGGSDGSTVCELDESQLRAAALLDLIFVVQATFAATLVVIVYAVIAKASGVGLRRNGSSYEALPRTSSGGTLNEAVGTPPAVVQMMAMGKNSSTQA